MKSWAWSVAAVTLGTLATACGPSDPACSEAIAVDRQIRDAAEIDMISTDKLCFKTAEGIAADLRAARGMTTDFVTIENRANQYVEACLRLRTLKVDCDN